MGAKEGWDSGAVKRSICTGDFINAAVMPSSNSGAITDYANLIEKQTTRNPDATKVSFIHQARSDKEHLGSEFYYPDELLVNKNFEEKEKT